ncbi:MAG: metallophosphoesterase [Candidatus Binatia bacterium]
MRVALISDLHGNRVSLDAVLADIDRRGVDQIVCLGDVATLGPRPREVIGTLRDRGCRCILGNHDAFMLDAELIRTYTEVPIVVHAVQWCRERLNEEDLAFLSSFEERIEMDLGAGTRALLFHGSPRSHMEDLLATMDPDELDEALGSTDATVLAGGHTHVQMLRQHRSMLLVNPGSTGMPFKEYVGGCAPEIMPYAEYAIIEAEAGEVQVSLRRISVDRRRLHEEAASSSNPICRPLEQQYA